MTSTLLTLSAHISGVECIHLTVTCLIVLIAVVAWLRRHSWRGVLLTSHHVLTIILYQKIAICSYLTRVVESGSEVLLLSRHLIACQLLIWVVCEHHLAVLHLLWVHQLLSWLLARHHLSPSSILLTPRLQ